MFRTEIRSLLVFWGSHWAAIVSAWWSHALIHVTSILRRIYQRWLMPLKHLTFQINRSRMKTLNWGKLKSWSWEWRCWQKNFRKQIRLLTSWALSQAKTQNLSRKTSITLKCPLVQAKPNLWNTKGKTQQSQQKRGRMAGLWLNPMRVWCQLERQLCVKIIQLMPQMKLKMR